MHQFPATLESIQSFGDSQMFKQIRNGARIIGGVAFAILGVVGIVLPLVPGIPFLMASVACFTSLEP